MATDVGIQYFSHLNGLILGNNWGDLIRMLDKALVTGIDFPQISTATINAQGDVEINLIAAHNATLFQIVELTGFTPTSLNQKYRIKGVPSTTQLVLKPKNEILETVVVTKGTGKLASLGYDIIFRDTGDVKRVYRAKSPTAQHPFIRVDESISGEGGGTYTSTYAKYAMVGLLEHMDHIDDYTNPNVLQLPFDIANPVKNWNIVGTGVNVVRGWSRWYWRRNAGPHANGIDTSAPSAGNSKFTLVGDKDAFYLNNTFTASDDDKVLKGCGIVNSAQPTDNIPPWFLMSYIDTNTSNNYINFANANGTTPLLIFSNYGYIFMPKNDIVSRISPHQLAYGIMPDYFSGFSGLYDINNVAALEIPINDQQSYLRGTFKHIHYCGKKTSTVSNASPILADTSMYVLDTGVRRQNSGGAFTAFYYYLGEL